MDVDIDSYTDSVKKVKRDWSKRKREKGKERKGKRKPACFPPQSKRLL